MVYIIALGSEDLDVSVRGYNKIKECGKVFVRSCELACGEFLKRENICFESFDDLFENAEDFDLVAEEIAFRVAKAGENADVCYLTDGCGAEDLASVSLCRAGAVLISASPKAGGILGKADGGILYISGEDYIARSGILGGKILIYDIDTFEKASDVKLKVTADFGDEVDVVLFDGTEHFQKGYEIDSLRDYSYLTSCLVLPAPLAKKERFNFDDLSEVVAVLRGENGCPWDKAQTHQSIRENMAEEAYEAMEAIDEEDPYMLEEELGDVLLQVSLHSQIAKEDGEFSVGDVITGITKKMITRHTHIFGDEKAESAEDSLDIWEKNKREEKHQETFTDTLLAVPKTLPALKKAQKIKKRASKAGFDWADASGVLAKVKEELSELEEAMENDTNIAEELGDLLFAVSCLASHLKLDAERELDFACKKFVSRFACMEDLGTKKGLNLDELSEEKLNDLYLEAKEIHKKGL